jgi:hypothetical protein
LDSDERRAEALLREIDSEIDQWVSTANVGVFRRLRWASWGAAEAVRILETQRRAGGLAPAGLEALKRYRKLHEAAELILVGHFPYPKDPTPPSSRGLPGHNG